MPNVVLHRQPEHKGLTFLSSWWFAVLKQLYYLGSPDLLVSSCYLQDLSTQHSSTSRRSAGTCRQVSSIFSATGVTQMRKRRFTVRCVI